MNIKNKQSATYSNLIIIKLKLYKCNISALWNIFCKKVMTGLRAVNPP